MTYTQAKKELSRIGTSRATGHALRAMYAKLIADTHGGKPITYFKALQRTLSDRETVLAARGLLIDRAAAWDVLMGIDI